MQYGVAAPQCLALSPRRRAAPPQIVDELYALSQAPPTDMARVIEELEHAVAAGSAQSYGDGAMPDYARMAEVINMVSDAPKM